MQAPRQFPRVDAILRRCRTEPGIISLHGALLNRRASEMPVPAGSACPVGCWVEVAMPGRNSQF